MFDVPVFDLGFHAYSRGALVLLAISAFLAALARGFSGFGSALIFVPLASTAIGPHAAAPLLLIIDGIAAAGLIPNAWRHADKRDVGTMSIGALVGVPADQKTENGTRAEPGGPQPRAAGPGNRIAAVTRKDRP